QISKVLRINIKVAKGLGSFFELQLSVINIDMLDLYKFLTDHISNFAKENGEMIFQDGKTRIIMTIRSEILTLFRIHIGNIKENNKNIITEKFIPALYEPLLDQFMNIHPLVRDHHVVSLFEVLIEKTGTEAKSLLPQIFSTLIKNTAEMVETRKSEFSEHGVKLYRLLKAIFVHCFPVILSLNESDFMYLYTRVINGVDHRSGEISRLGLEIV
ncbi:Exportin-1, partial [Bonamia ostreae]